MTTAVGLIAAFCTTLAFLPQVIKIWRTKSVGDLSMGTFIVFTCGVAMWLIYGTLIDDLPVIVANAVTLALQSTILFQMVRYRVRPIAPEHP
ncbi:MAG: SemiSWEET transporter [Bacteroidetes bacterium]|nr:SemiSWEET transporter [Bacteroidota bacterium]MDA0873704.1 SemiSWEET transporter [Bacteroidota bacterium]